MRKKLEEKRLQREAVVSQAVSREAGPQAVVKAAAEGERKEEGGKGVEVEVRRQWGNGGLRQAPVLAQQCGATGVVRDGEYIIVTVFSSGYIYFKHSPKYYALYCYNSRLPYFTYWQIAFF